MKRSLALIALLVLLLPGAAWSQGLPTATPEEVGLSSQKLARAKQKLTTKIGCGPVPTYMSSRNVITGPSNAPGSG